MMNWHGPFLLSFVDREVNDLERGFFVGKDLAISDRLSNYTVDAFDCVGRVDRLSNLWRVFEHRSEVRPVSIPTL